MSDPINDHQAAWREFRSRQRSKPAPAQPQQQGRRSRRGQKVLANKPVVDNHDRLLLVKLDADLLRLSQQASRMEKNRLQAEFLKSPTYVDYLTKAQAGQGMSGEDPVLVRCMIWAFNVGDISLAMTLGDIAYKRQLAMPDDFKADVSIFICREIAYWALAEQKAGNSPQPWLNKVFDKSRNWDKPDQVEARLLKAKAQELQETDPAAALELYEKAIAFDKGVGVAHVIKRLTKQLLVE